VISFFERTRDFRQNRFLQNMQCIPYVIRYVIFCFWDKQINLLYRSSPSSLTALQVRNRSRRRFSRLRHTHQPKNFILLPSTNAQQYIKLYRAVFSSSLSSHFRLYTVSSSAEFVLRSLDSRRLLRVSGLTILYFRFIIPYPHLHRLRSLYPRVQPVEVSPSRRLQARRRLRGGDFGGESE